MPSKSEICEQLRFLLEQMDPEDRSILELILPRRPLLDVLNIILSLWESDQHDADIKKSSMHDLAELVIKYHDHPRALLETLRNFILTNNIEQTGQWVADLDPIDRPLAMQLLTHLALSLSRQDIAFTHRAFEVEHLIARHSKLELDDAVVFHQQANTLFDLKDYDAAERAYAEAHKLFEKAGRGFVISNATNWGNCIAHRMANGGSLPAQSEIEIILRLRPPRNLIFVLASRAFDQEDVKLAQRYLGYIDLEVPSDNQRDTPLILLSSRLARYLGDFDKADRLLNMAKDATRGAEESSTELQRQAYFLERDLNPSSTETESLMQQLSQSEGAQWSRYQEALLQLFRGRWEEANRLFRLCLTTCRPEQEPDCLSMIAHTSQDPLESSRLFHRAIGLFHRANRKIDHAVSLTLLARLYRNLGFVLTEQGYPASIVKEFRMALQLFARAEFLAESSGAKAAATDYCRAQGKLASERGDPARALKHFGRVLGRMETTYLSFTDPLRAQSYAEDCTSAYESAVKCAIEIDRLDIALAISDRSKALRLTHGFQGGDGDFDSGEQSHSQGSLVWRRVLQGKQLAPDERLRLEEDRKARTEHNDNWSYGRYLQNIYSLIFPLSKVDVHLADFDPLIEPASRFSDGLNCDACGVFSRTESSYCSACEQLLPKSQVSDLSEAGSTRAYADYCYNYGLSLLKAGDVEQAEQSFSEAYRHLEHPDYVFFAGYCRLLTGNIEGTLECFDQAIEHQFNTIIPFWPLPVKPTKLKELLAMLRVPNCDQDVARRLLNTFMDEYFHERGAA